MTIPSPSEFLTFHRRLTTSLLYRSRPVSRLPRRQFTAATVSRADTGSGNIISDKGTQQEPGSGNETGGSREHALDKGDKKDPNLQSYESNKGRSYVKPKSRPKPEVQAKAAPSAEGEVERRYTRTLNLRTGSEHTFSMHDDVPHEKTYADAIRAQRESQR